MTVRELMDLLSQCTDPNRTVTIGLKKQKMTASLDEVYLAAEGDGPNGRELVVALVNADDLSLSN